MTWGSEAEYPNSNIDIPDLPELIEKGERENIEFKERLDPKIHLKSEKLHSLAAQMKHRILEGSGVAIYVIGVTDNGGLKGIEKEIYEKSIEVLSSIATEAGAVIKEIEKHDVPDSKGKIGVAKIVDTEESGEHIVIGTAGHVDHGKSTLVGSLVTGNPDNGDAKTSSYLDIQPHERERGLSADLSYGVYGFSENNPIKLKNPLSKKERSEVVEKADKLVSFIDTVGHEPWLRTTIRGIIGGKLDYGLVVVAADDGPTSVTREHLGLLLATDLPTIIAITKTDIVNEKRINEVEEEVKQLLKNIGKIPYKVENKKIHKVIEELPMAVPILRTSAVTLQGFDKLDKLFRQLPKRREVGEGEFEMYIDRTYQVTGVGTVASGTVRNGEIKSGDTIYLGPMEDGTFKEVEARSIEMHYRRVRKAKAGDIVGIAISGEGKKIERGMVLSSEPKNPVKKFKAEILVLNHPTKIQNGYEPVLHLETVSEAAVIKPNEDCLLPGERGKAMIEFKYHPYAIEKGQRFVFREGESKGVGTVTKIIENT